MASKQEYIQDLQAVIAKVHGCRSTHVESVPVHEVFRGQTVWQGVVEVFDMIGHVQAKRCYAWSHLDGKDDSKRRYVAVLEIPPVKSPQTAVQASIVADLKKPQ